MRKSAMLLSVLVVMLCALLAGSAHAQNFETWVSGAGSDGSSTCSRGAPCASFAVALSKTTAGGQINVMDSGNFGTVSINKSVTIANDTSGTATLCCTGDTPAGLGVYALIFINAGPDDVVALRGLTVKGLPGFTGESGVVISSAAQVNIEKCTFRAPPALGILVSPNSVSINVKIEDTIVTGGAGGMKISSSASAPVNVSISRSSFQNTSGGGIRIDATPGGAITVAISDSTINFNGGNGINALAGPAQNIVSIERSIIARNGGVGVQAGGANTGVLLSDTLLDMNVSGATAVVNGGNMFTYGNNRIVGALGSGFTASGQMR
jgi:hypothetical protein